LKPANFVCFRGTLRLIDFGIAKAIVGHTTNIVRDTQTGTANYIAPEALEFSGDKIKVQYAHTLPH
jgi:serine/threonine-protein kinase TTK/MPS1